MKTCRVCGITGEDDSFVKKENLCKKCNSEIGKKYRQENKERIKELQKTWNEINYEKNKEKKKNYYQENKEYIKNKSKKWKESNIEKAKETQKKYYQVNKEKIDERNKKWIKNNPKKAKEIGKKSREKNKERIKERQRIYRLDNKEKIKEKNKRYLEENPGKRKETLKNYYYNNIDKIKEYFKTHYLENKEMIYERQKKYLQTTNGKKTTTKQNFKRRQLGHEPLNEWFKGSEAHHLRYSKTPEEQDNDVTLYVPRKLHRSIPHNGNTGKNMRQINVLLLEWYLNSTPEEERNPKAVKLYWNYCTLPEPDWSNNSSDVLSTP